MAGDYSAVKAALIVAIQGITSPIDLSGDGAVSVERFPGGALSSLPRAYVTPSSPAARYNATGRSADLSSWEGVARFDVVIVVERSDGGRTEAAESAMNALMIALGADRTLGNEATDVEAVLSVVQGSEMDSRSYGVAYAVVIVTFTRVS